MTQNLFVVGAEPGSGKSIIVLGMMEMLSGLADRVGFFRPVIRGGPENDPLITMIRERYRLPLPYQSLFGSTSDEARRMMAEDRYDDLLGQILDKYRSLVGRCDQVLCAGTDYGGGHSPLEFDFNADVANNLNCLIVPVVRGNDRRLEEVFDATVSFRKSLEERDCDLLATVINRVDPELVDSLRRRCAQIPAEAAPVFVVPEVRALALATVGDIARDTSAEIIYGAADTLSREVRDYKIAAMEAPDFLPHLTPDCLVIAPGNRADILLASLLAYDANTYPQIAGMVLSGGQRPAPAIARLLEGLGEPPFAVLGMDSDTFSVAMAVSSVRAALSADNDRRIATALGTVESSLDLSKVQQRLASTRSARVTPLMFEYDLVHRAKQHGQHIVLPEGMDERILRAAEILMLREVVTLTLLGNPEQLEARIKALGLRLPDVQLLDPMHSEWRGKFAETYYELRRHKGISSDMALDAMADVSYFGTMMVHHGLADGMVSGAAHTTQHTIRPAFEIIKTRPGTAIVSSVFFMCLEDRVLVYGDCAVNPEPDAEQLADIAINSAGTARSFGIEPRVAMLSYSTGDSGKGDAVETVRKATAIAREHAPGLMIEGPIQYDAAVDIGVARAKLPGSEVAGNATVFIFPDLNTGNNTYKAVQRSAGAVAIGPVLQGLKKPVNDLSRGCTVTDIVNTVAITAVQAQLNHRQI